MIPNTYLGVEFEINKICTSEIIIPVPMIFSYFRAAKNIAKAERDDASGNKSQMLYTLEFITEMFIQLAHATPFLTLQWCYILKVHSYIT